MMKQIIGDVKLHIVGGSKIDDVAKAVLKVFAAAGADTVFTFNRVEIKLFARDEYREEDIIGMYHARLRG